MRSTPRLLIALFLLAAACSNNKATTTAESTEKPKAKASPGMMMELPDYAKDFKTTFASPEDGVKVTGNTLAVSVDASGFDLRCDLAAKRDEDGTGHYHLLLDKELINMFCTRNATISMQNVTPGEHELEVVPALNQHDEVMEGAQKISFDYEPTDALPVITDEEQPGEPSIEILSPKAGDTVSGDFDVKVRITGFESSCDLYGKPGVAGYGHWHANLDFTSGPMMGMAGEKGFGGMLGMSCTDTFHVSTAGIKSGETHAIIALLVDNAHAPLHPAVEDRVDVRIG